jgi:hypothetical protein
LGVSFADAVEEEAREEEEGGALGMMVLPTRAIVVVKAW